MANVWPGALGQRRVEGMLERSPKGQRPDGRYLGGKFVWAELSEAAARLGPSQPFGARPEGVGTLRPGSPLQLQRGRKKARNCKATLGRQRNTGITQSPTNERYHGSPLSKLARIGLSVDWFNSENSTGQTIFIFRPPNAVQLGKGPTGPVRRLARFRRWGKGLVELGLQVPMHKEVHTQQRHQIRQQPCAPALEL